MFKTLKKRNTYLSFFIFMGVFLGTWWIASLEDWTYGDWFHRLNGIGTIFGIAGYTLFSFSLLLSTRWKKLEDWLGGLDQIYHFHHQLGLWGFIFILAHPLILALKWLPDRLDKFLWFIFPFHERLSINLGSWAFWLMIIFLGITFLKLLPYDKWKITHKFMSVVFILASLHVLLSERKFSYSTASNALLFIPMALGLFSIVYKQIVLSFLAKRHEFEVIDTKIVSDNVIEIILHSKKGGIDFIPGQYGFFSFKGAHLTEESHPFTLCGFPKEDKVSIFAKNRGDFTKNLYKHIKPKYLAYFEGPYGRFDYTKAGTAQIWIAGGIGILPFITWTKSLLKKGDQKRKIDLFYCVHRKSDAIFLKEFHKAAHTLRHFQCYLFCTEENNRLDAQKILNTCGQLKGEKILICGPKRLTDDLTKQLRALDVKEDNIVFEDFEFF